MSSTYSYRVKFKDIRVKPSKEDTSRARATQTRVCEHASCDLAGDHPAPRNDGKPGKFWFCQRHAGEYNKSFDFFDGMTEAEIAAFQAGQAYGHQKTWKFGRGPMGGAKAARSHDPRTWSGRQFFDLGGEGPAEARSSGRTRLQIRALGELDLPESASPKDIRERYADYVRRFHPDSNGGDRSMEAKLARVIRAWKTLKAAGLTKD